MPIETKIKKIYSFPPYSQYKPPRIPMNKLQQIIISLEEFEALKLVDYENQPQRKAALSMDVSQATLNRLLKSARNKIAKGLVNGYALILEGGKNVLPCRIFKCGSCSHQWSPEEQGFPKKCPICGSEEVSRIHNEDT